jgi:hypothetical protein
MKDKEFTQNPDVVFDACRDAVGYFGGKIADVDFDTSTLRAHTPMSWKSFGDVVIIEVSNRANGAIASVSSKPRMGITNWGKDRANEGKFLEKLAQEIHRQ